MSPSAATIPRQYSGSLSLKPAPAGTPQTTPMIVQSASLPGGNQIRGGSLSIPSAQPVRQSSGSIQNPAPRAFQSLGPVASGGIGERASPFASHPNQIGSQAPRNTVRMDMQPQDKDINSFP